ncbi:hypothetical protein [Actinoallomurus sp. NPDC052274]|uniref:hypothetical protein n=1 Tax=Actinoallomurus sp. NPDC052274 TaxID=3155420 RepID=UPI003435B7B2
MTDVALVDAHHHLWDTDPVELEHGRGRGPARPADDRDAVPGATARRGYGLG